MENLYYELSLNDLYHLEINRPTEIGNVGEVYNHVFLTNLIKVGKCTMLSEFFNGPMERPLKVFPWQQGCDLFNEVEYQVPQDILVPEVDFGILSAGLEPYTVTKTITGYNLEHNTDKWGFLKAKVTIAPVIIGPLEITDAITTNGEHTIVKRADENGMSSVTFTVNVPQGGGQVQEMFYNLPNSVQGYNTVIEPNEGYIGISRLNLQIRPLNLGPINVNIVENGERTILPMNLQDGFTSVNITTNVPVTEEISTNIRYVSLVDSVGDDDSYYYDIRDDIISLAHNTSSLTVEPGETLLIIKKIDRNASIPYNEYRFKFLSISEDQYSLDMTVNAGEYFFKRYHSTEFIVFYNENKEMVSKFNLVEKSTFTGIIMKWYFTGQINFNLDLVNIPNILFSPT